MNYYIYFLKIHCNVIALWEEEEEEEEEEQEQAKLKKSVSSQKAVALEETTDLTAKEAWEQARAKTWAALWT